MGQNNNWVRIATNIRGLRGESGIMDEAWGGSGSACPVLEEFQRRSKLVFILEECVRVGTLMGPIPKGRDYGSSVALVKSGSKGQ